MSAYWWLATTVAPNAYWGVTTAWHVYAHASAARDAVSLVVRVGRGIGSAAAYVSSAAAWALGVSETSGGLEAPCEAQNNVAWEGGEEGEDSVLAFGSDDEVG